MSTPAKGDVELCVYTGDKWVAIPDGLADLRSLLDAAVGRLNRVRRVDNITRRVLGSMIIEEIQNMPEPGEPT